MKSKGFIMQVNKLCELRVEKSEHNQ